MAVQGHADARFLVFENLEAGMSIDGIIEQYPVTREQINTVLEFAARSAAPPSRTKARMR